MINGPEAFTPDNEYILGESEVRGFFVAAGFSAHGIAGAGGIGRQMASWIVDGEPELDLWKMDIRRFGAAYRSRAYTLARSIENYATYYDIHYPNEERQAGRPLRTSPTYELLRELGASFGEKSGWERPNWFDSNAAAGDEALRPRGWAGMHWSPAIGAEALATRQAAGLFDESSFAKLEVSGPGATAFLGRMCANDVDRRGRLDRLHPAAQPARRDRGRPDRDAPRARRVPHRDRHRGRQPRRRVAPPPPARRRLGVAPRRHGGAGLLRAVGAAGARHPGRRHARRRLRRRLPVPHRARDHGRVRPVPGAPGDVRRRARLGAVRPDRIRSRAVDDALGRGPAARPRRRRVPRDRRAPPREGLSRLVERHHPGRDAVRGRARVRRGARQGARVHRPRRAGGGEGRRPARSACAASCSTIRARSASATNRCASVATSSGG